jgi:hypothetical protein
MTTTLPTLAEQRAADPVTNLSVACLDAVRAFPRAPDAPAQRAHRVLPTGVYVEQGRCLIAHFNRWVDGKPHNHRVARGALGDFSAETAQRLAQECAAAAAQWDAEHGRG